MRIKIKINHYKGKNIEKISIYLKYYEHKIKLA